MPYNTWLVSDQRLRQYLLPKQPSPAITPQLLQFNGLGGITGAQVAATDTGVGNPFDVVNVGTGATFTYDNSHGSQQNCQSVNVTTNGTSAQSFGRWTASFVDSDFIWFSMYLYVPANFPTTVGIVLGRRNGDASNCGQWRINASGQIVLADATITAVGTTVNSIPLGKPFRLEGRMTQSQGQGGVMEVRLYADDNPLSTPIEVLTVGGVLTAQSQGNQATSGIRWGVTAATTAVVNFNMWGMQVSNVAYPQPLGPTPTYQTFNPPVQALPYNNFPWFGPGVNYPHIQQVSTALPDVFVPGSAANVNVNAQFADATVNVLVDGVGQVANVNVASSGQVSITTLSNIPLPTPFPAILPNSLQFNSSYIALRQQYSTALPDVFVPGSAGTVNVSAPSGATSDLIDGSGQVANVNVSAPAGQVQIFQPFNPQSPFPAVLPNQIRFNPAFESLRVQQSTATPDVFVPGSVANVNVAASSGTITELIDGTGAVANVNAVAQSGQIQVFQTFAPQFSGLPVLPSAIRFQPAYQALRVQYNTGLPGVFVPGTTGTVNVVAQSGTVTILEDGVGAVSNVNVSAPAGSVTITTYIPPQYPFPPLLPGSLKFVPAYANLRVQNNTGTPIPIGGVVGGLANVTVSGQTDNSILETISGTVANVNAVAAAGTINIYQNFNPPFPVPVLLSNSIRFNNSFIGLRQQYSTVLPDVFVPGSTGNVNVTGPAGTVVEFIDGTGQTANVNAVANPGSLSVILIGTSANVNISGVAGASVILTGSTGLVNSAAIAGTVGSPSVNIAGVTATVNVSALAGGFVLSNFFDPNWWRVYRGYGQAPMW